VTGANALPGVSKAASLQGSPERIGEFLAHGKKDLAGSAAEMPQRPRDTFTWPSANVLGEKCLKFDESKLTGLSLLLLSTKTAVSEAKNAPCGGHFEGLRIEDREEGIIGHSKEIGSLNPWWIHRVLRIVLLRGRAS
jgi:hypothetical protein